MSEQEKCEKALELLKELVNLSIGFAPLYMLEVQRVIGQITFQMWLIESRESGE